ncbi:hypothetical protein EGR_10674 [Echinococcus granulosus]|uniref:Uncharacterized protein n=1 Tax=Echinococcus granulosus TaxID=6210 RepID=W6U068_ECHGR|nr:hypothetical protein EGR_10674 [Echinococcus granulosus]EUB54475.1 hypothetical protein EGR_10674 [Echinococcus granulosus]
MPVIIQLLARQTITIMFNVGELIIRRSVNLVLEMVQASKPSLPTKMNCQIIAATTNSSFFH